MSEKPAGEWLSADGSRGVVKNLFVLTCYEKDDAGTYRRVGITNPNVPADAEKWLSGSRPEDIATFLRMDSNV